MIRIVVDDAGKLTQRESMALGHMFMHLAGHSLHQAEAVTVTVNGNMNVTGEVATAKDKVLKDGFFNGPECDSCEDNPANYATVPSPPAYVKPAVDIVSKRTEIISQEDVELFEEELIHTGPEGITTEPTATWEDQEVPVAVLRDAAGIRWDDRIHAKNKSQTASGLWKLGRHLSPDFVKQVQAELRAEIASCLTPLTPVVSAPVPPPPAQIPAPPAFVPPPPVPNVPMPPPIPVPPPIPAQNENEDLYRSLLAKVNEGVNAKRFAMTSVVAVLKSFKDAAGNPICRHMGEVQHRPDLIPAIAAELDRISVGV